MSQPALKEALSPRGAMGSIAQAQERIGALPMQVTMREAWLGHARVSEGDRVLDVGCGTGVVTRDLARLVGTFGKVIAVDPSEALLRVAARLAIQEGVASRIEFRWGEASELPLPPQSVDHVVLSLVFQSLPDPRGALHQARRVLRPGGGLVIFEQDLQALAVDHPDAGLTRILLQHGAEHYVLAADAARRLPGLCADLGFGEVEVLTFLQAERTEDGMLFDLLRRLARFAAARARIREESAQAWVETLEHKAADGSFFASLPHYAILARKPTFSGKT